MRRPLVVLAAVLVLLAIGAAARVVHDRHECPPGPWAHPLVRLFGGSYRFAC